MKSRASPSSRRKKEKEHEETSYDIAIGSRAHMAVNSVKSRALHRTILMYGFHCLVYIFCTRHICDTQCGFKLFRRAAAQRIFSGLHLERWAFDIELIYLAEALNFTIVEVSYEMIVLL